MANTRSKDKTPSSKEEGSRATTRSNSVDSPLRRSTRETKKVSVTVTPPPTTTTKKEEGSAGRSSKSNKGMRKRKLSLSSLSPSSSTGKNKVSGGGSSSKSWKKKLKGKKKVVAESNNTSLNSSGSGQRNNKRKRALLHAKAYAKSFKPQPLPKRIKLSEDQDSKEKEIESNKSNKAEKETSKLNAGETSKLRVQDSPSSSSESSEHEQSPSPSKENDVSEKDLRNVDIQVLSVPAESRAVLLDCEVLPLQTRVMPHAPTEKKKMQICDESQTDEQLEAFVCCVCKRPTPLCCEGKGCKRSYHPMCVNPPIEEMPPGTWLCIACVKKKIQFGVYSISKGIESIWDVKEGGQSGKQYFVKYKNLAHIHNRWISESEAFREAPELVSKFNWKIQKEKAQTTRFKSEWTHPSRLLHHRSLMPHQTADEFFEGPADNLPYCNGEWLVKWRDLGYESATWELENSEVLVKEEGVRLVKEFENRKERARRASNPNSASRALEVKKAPLAKLDELPDGFPPGLDNDHLVSTNKIREFWHKSRNAVFIDEQERLIKTITFIMSIIEDITRPILIVSNMTNLSFWESKFHRLAPNINVVTYTGPKKVRKLIQDLEFYEEGGCIMFQVLLSHPDAILEDFETIECVGWEAIIVDECQNFRMAKNLEKFKSLTTDFRLLLLSSQIKDIISEYINILSFLDPNNETSSPQTTDKEKEKNSIITILKERFSRHVAYECKLDSPKFVEYWVPVKMSNIQLELYASTLISSSSALKSFSKIDHVGALRETLLTLRKCCDHPYLVDLGLQNVLIENRPPSEILNMGVLACGKLLLLDKLLKEMHARGTRVLILFQSGGGSGRNQIGEFLDDFLRQRFGQNSFECLEKGLQPSRRQMSINNFNDKSKGRFAFLIENRACLTSVKLSFVDAVLIYNSDWSPMNDLRALQKISIQPVPVHLPVFRLYSACAVEEKVLLLAKQDVYLDSTLHGVVPSVSQSLLSWGAVNLFSSWNKPYSSDELISSEAVSFIDEVAGEILSKLSHGVINGVNLVVEAPYTGTSYSRNYSSKLEGEKAGVKSLDVDPNVFWSGLFERNSNMQWRFVMAEPDKRSRRKVQLFDSLDKGKEKVVGESDEARKRRTKNGDDVVGTGSPRGRTAGTGLNIRNISCEELEGASLRATQAEQWVTEGTQKGLHLLLKPQLLSLCGFAGLPDYVKKMAEMLLEYVMNNFKVDPEPESILQAFVVSLCWRAASLLKHWLDVDELVSLASSFLHYSCERSHVESIYTRLKILKTEFKSQADEILTEWDPPVRSQNQLFKIPKQEAVVNLQEPSTSQMQEHILNDQLQNQFDLIERVCARRQNAVLTKHRNELLEIENYKEREMSLLKKEQELALKNLNWNFLTSDDSQVKNAKERIEKKIRTFENHVLKQRQKMEVAHARASQIERNLRDEWVQNAKSGNLKEDFDNVPLPDFGFRIEEFIWAGYENVSDVISEERGVNERVNGEGTSNGEIDGDGERDNDDESGNGEMVVEETRNEGTVNGETERNGSSEQLVNNGGTDQNISGQVSEGITGTQQDPPVPPTIPLQSPVPVPITLQSPIPVTLQSPIPIPTPIQIPLTNSHTTASTSNPTIIPPQQQQNTEQTSSTRTENGNGNSETNNNNSNSALLQMLPMASPVVFPQGLSPDPLKNELVRIKQQEEILTRRYEYKKTEVEKEYAQELEKVRKKYEEILNTDKSSFQQQKQLLEDVYKKVLVNQSLAEEFRVKFIEHRGTAANSSPNASSSSQPQGGRNPVPIIPRLQQAQLPPRTNQNQMALPPRQPYQIPMPHRPPHQIPSSMAPHRRPSNPTSLTPNPNLNPNSPATSSPFLMPRIPSVAQAPPSNPTSLTPNPNLSARSSPHMMPRVPTVAQVHPPTGPPPSSNPTSLTPNPNLSPNSPATSASFTIPRVPSIAQTRPSTGPSILSSVSQTRPSTTPSIPTLSVARPLNAQNDTPSNLSQLNPVTLNISPASTSMKRTAPHLSRFRLNPSTSTNQSNPISTASSNAERLRSMFASALGSGSGSTSAGTSVGNGNVNVMSGQRSNSPLLPQTEDRQLSSVLDICVNANRTSTNDNSTSNNNNNVSNNNNGVSNNYNDVNNNGGSNNNNGVSNGQNNNINNNENGGDGEEVKNGDGVVCLSDDESRV